MSNLESRCSTFKKHIVNIYVSTSEAYKPEAYNFVAMLGFFRKPIKIYFLINEIVVRVL